MKLAEALTLRGAQDKKIRELRVRLQNSARYLEGEEPSENAGELLSETRRLIADQAVLVARINKTNAETFLGNGSGITLTEALARRAMLSAEIGLLNEIADAASPGRDPYTRRRRTTELPEKTNLPVPSLRAEADGLSRTHRELDAQIQQLNWVAELL